jgi:hypothetical protein
LIHPLVAKNDLSSHEYLSPITIIVKRATVVDGCYEVLGSAKFILQAQEHTAPFFRTITRRNQISIIFDQFAPPIFSHSVGRPVTAQSVIMSYIASRRNLPD